MLLWIVQVVTALGFLLAALGKFASDPEVVATFDAIGVGDWLRYLLGVLEIAGAIALFIPRLTGLAGLAFVALTTGAVLAHVFVVGSDVAVPVPLLVLSALVAWGRWGTTVALFDRVRGARESRPSSTPSTVDARERSAA